jgi:hypothetical protein
MIEMANKEILQLIKERKQQTSDLVRYANPKSKTRPCIERVLQIVSAKIPYKGLTRPVVTSAAVTYYSRNQIIKTARFRVETAFHGAWEISAYQHLKGRSKEERQADNNSTFPSGLFTIFADRIKEGV